MDIPGHRVTWINFPRIVVDVWNEECFKQNSGVDGKVDSDWWNNNKVWLAGVSKEVG